MPEKVNESTQTMNTQSRRTFISQAALASLDASQLNEEILISELLKNDERVPPPPLGGGLGWGNNTHPPLYLETLHINNS